MSFEFLLTIIPQTFRTLNFKGCSVPTVTGFGETMINTGDRPAGVDVILGNPVTPATLRQAVTGEDPRLAFVGSLLDTIPTEGTIVAYSGYEQATLRQLAIAHPEFEEALSALCDRTFDLLKLIRENYYHPQFHGSFSIKSVLPALVPEMSYGDLEIQDGLIAAIDFGRMVAEDTPAIEK